MYLHIHVCIDVHNYADGDMTVPEGEYNSPPPHGKGRTPDTMTRNSSFSWASNLVIDELYLLRIGDVLLRNVILQANSLDHMVYIKEGRRSDNHA